MSRAGSVFRCGLIVCPPLASLQRVAVCIPTWKNPIMSTPATISPTFSTSNPPPPTKNTATTPRKPHFKFYNSKTDPQVSRDLYHWLSLAPYPPSPSERSPSGCSTRPRSTSSSVKGPGLRVRRSERARGSRSSRCCSPGRARKPSGSPPAARWGLSVEPTSNPWNRVKRFFFVGLGGAQNMIQTKLNMLKRHLPIVKPTLLGLGI